MAKQFVLMSLLLCVSLGITLCTNSESGAYKCCMPDQWGGTLFISSGSEMVPLNWTLFTNGTAVFAYDVELEKLFLGMEMIDQSPQIPQNLHVNWTMLYDFKKVSTNRVLAILLRIGKTGIGPAEEIRCVFDDI